MTTWAWNYSTFEDLDFLDGQDTLTHSHGVVVPRPRALQRVIMRVGTVGWQYRSDTQPKVMPGRAWNVHLKVTNNGVTDVLFRSFQGLVIANWAVGEAAPGLVRSAGLATLPGGPVETDMTVRRTNPAAPAPEMIVSVDVLGKIVEPLQDQWFASSWQTVTDLWLLTSEPG